MLKAVEMNYNKYNLATLSEKGIPLNTLNDIFIF